VPSQGGWWSAVSGSCQLHPMLVSHGCMVRALKAKSCFCACCHDDSAEGQLWATQLVVSWSPRSHLMVGWSVPSHQRSVSGSQLVVGWSLPSHRGLASGSQLVVGWSAPSHRWPVVGSQLVVKSLPPLVSQGSLDSGVDSSLPLGFSCGLLLDGSHGGLVVGSCLFVCSWLVVSSL
jgi:hypothetical protein